MVVQVTALENAGRADEAEVLAHASVREQLGDALRAMARDDSSLAGLVPLP